jgi:4-hydroxy-tetrahydrodipicolinate synthase
MPSAHPAVAAFGRNVVAMVTPFHPDGTLDLAGAQSLAAHLVEQGCDGLVVNGTTGESPTTDDAEKEALLRAVITAVSGRARVTFGAGSNDTAHSVHLAELAVKAGADGVLVVTPYYNKPPVAGLLAHFRAVADSGELPVMLYDIPGRSGIPIPSEVLLELARHPRILAVKDAKGDLFAGSEVMAGSDLAFYSGDDALNLAWLCHGAVGVVSVVGHVAAAEYADMIAAVGDGDLPRALRRHRQLVPAVRGLMNRTQGAITAKAALCDAGVIGSDAVRLPLVGLTDDLRALVRADLAAADLSGWAVRA